MSRLIHLNGLPGIGKSTLARRYAADHPGVLLCDIDVVRMMISDWQDTAEAAERSRIVGLAMATAYLGTGRDVVLPQLVADPGQLARFVGAADEAGAAYVHVMLTADDDVVARRFRARAAASDDEWTAFATAHWDAAGGDEALIGWATRLDDLPATRLGSTDPDTTYAGLLALLAVG
jgi:predicted kinase